MFKFAKYYVLVNLYKRTNKNIVRVLLSVLLMVLVSYLFADIILVAGEENSYVFLSLKWMILLISIFVIVLNTHKVIKIVSSPFFKEITEAEIDVKKERILAKKHLMTKSERIIEKYRSA